MQSTGSNLEFKLNVYLRLVKPVFMQSTAGNLEFKPKVIFKLLSCKRPKVFIYNLSLNVKFYLITLELLSFLYHHSRWFVYKTSYMHFSKFYRRGKKLSYLFAFCYICVRFRLKAYIKFI